MRLAYFHFSTAFVHGGHLQGQISVALSGFRSCAWKIPQIFLARSFGARDVFTVALLEARETEPFARQYNWRTFSFRLLVWMEVTHTAKSRGESERLLIKQTENP